MSELKPCPFCGADAEVTEMYIGDNMTPYYRISCKGADLHSLDFLDYNKKIVIGAWNTRQSPKAQNNHELTELSHMEFIQGNPEKAIEIATKALKDKGHPVPPSIADVFLDLINRYNEPYSGLMEVVSAINILIKEDNLAVEIKEESK